MRNILATLALAMTVTAGGADLPIAPLIPPGYVLPDDAKQDERGLWMEMAEVETSLSRSPLVLKHEPIARYVSDLACEIAADYCDDLRVYVVRNPSFNASMAPNGILLVQTGLLARSLRTDHVASVLGHELAHYTQTHSIKRWRAAKARMTAGSIVSMGLALGGISSGGLPELFALSSVMGFTRKQEAHADLLGTHFMSRAGYDPAAAAEVWQLLEEEEAQASVKRPKGPLWLSSHPQPEARAAKLNKVAAILEHEKGGSTQFGEPATDQYVNMLQASYALLMDEQVQQRDHGRLDALLRRHEMIGINPSDVAFYRGETWRVRGGAGDHENAMAEYRKAVSMELPNTRAFRELGYLEYRYGDQEVAKDYFRTFLELKPDATDRQMIEQILLGGW